MKKITSRKFHRLLSIVIGIQLLLWTVSGLIFSWNPIKKVRGEDRIRQQEPLDLSSWDLKDINEIIESNQNAKATVHQVKLKDILGKPVYELSISGAQEKSRLVHAVTGEVLSPISKTLAEDIALNDFSEGALIKKSEFIESDLGPHSEYRKKEIPVWRVELDHSSGTVIYVSAHRGEVVTRRNNRWRMFDFFWMLHTMDYQGRDNFNSWLLRIMSAFGVLSVLTGYWLWFRTRKKTRKQS